MSRLTVVVPVYNVERYIDACLESLQHQTLDDIEIICVNDGSQDESLDRLRLWEKKDHRIQIVDKPNGGLSSARNAGLRAAASPYVCFLDSDDSLRINACSEIVNIFESSHADVLTFGATWSPEDAAQPWLIEALSPRDVAYEGFSPSLLFDEASCPFVWRTACRVAFLREQGIVFDEHLSFGEDMAFQFAVYPRSSKTVLSSKRLYDYRLDRVGSLMSGVEGNRFLKMSKHLDVLNSIYSDWKDGGFLDLYPEKLLSFSLDYALYGSLRLPDEEFQIMVTRFCDLLERYWSKSEIETMDLPAHAKKLFEEACVDAGPSGVNRTWLAFRYALGKSGWRGILSRLFGVVRQ